MFEKSSATGSLFRSALLPDVTPDMLSADFWVSDSDSAADKSAYRDPYQTYIRSHTTSMNRLFELLHPASELEQWNVTAPLPSQSHSESPTLYGPDGQGFPAAFWEALAEKVEQAAPIAASEAGRLQPGFAVRRANLRRYPVASPGFRTPTDKEFDRFQDTALHTFEPVVIVLQTEDHEWYYVISETYKGWVTALDIARCTAEEFETWSRVVSLDPHNAEAEFVIPLANNIYTQAAPYDESVSEQRLEFSACIPVCREQQGVGNQSIVGNLAVWLPVRNPEGWLDVRRALVPASAPLSVGVLPYTRKSVVDSAFAVLGERYGWGDSFGNHDCSSLIMDSYRTIGLQFPRDAGKQEQALPNRVRIPETLTFDERSELLKSFHPGDPLYMPGHTMMYLGYRHGHHYVIHDFSGYTVLEGEHSMFVPVNEVMVSTLDIRVSSGKTYLESLTAAASLFEEREL
ncbi:SH3 domain-containing protein [Alicyclobacillus ferrooxydans]|uniref:SH3 domain-containing protein n=1 Tax=Alicyclobacillus ferrooxydans TaxID=471514 RepID=UPI0006D59944|nr:SH3 domain-containing protein [Alicyclobacillus ferrooxydans]